MTALSRYKDESGHWKPEAKTEVAQQLMVHGNVRIASENTGVPVNTIHEWKKSEWWDTVWNEVALQKRAEFNGRLGTIVERSLAVVEDRLERGDFIFNNKTGETIRKPVNIRDASKVASDLIAKQIKLEEMNRKETTIDTATIQDTLQTLAKEFAKFNSKKTNATDIPFVEKV